MVALASLAGRAGLPARLQAVSIILNRTGAHSAAAQCHPLELHAGTASGRCSCTSRITILPAGTNDGRFAHFPARAGCHR